MDSDYIWQNFLIWFAGEYSVEDRATTLGLRETCWRAYQAGWLKGLKKD
jgi:hypothetical protein